MKTEIKNRILGTVTAGILAAGLITPVFAQTDTAPAADGDKPAATKGHKDGCKGKNGCKGKKGHHKGKKKAADAPAADAPTKTE